MNKPLAFALLIAGVVLVVYGLNSNDSLSSETSKLFTGAPTNKALFLMVGGVIAVALGLFSLVRSPRST